MDAKIRDRSKGMKPAAQHTDAAPDAPAGARWEIGMGLALTAFLVLCHVIRWLSAGGLWRDEANSVYLASDVSFADNWLKLHLDSSPFAWFLILRAWRALGLGDADLNWRLLGLLVGLTCLALTWLAARVVSTQRMSRVPLVALFLIGFSPESLMTGDSIRAYGLGMCCAVGAIIAMWRALQEPTPRRWTVAAAALCLAVHAHFLTIPAVFALCMTAATMGLFRRSVGLTITPLVIGAFVASTLTVYGPMFAARRDVTDFLQQPLGPRALLAGLLDSLQQVGFGDPAAVRRMTPLTRLAAAAIWGSAFAGFTVLTWSRWPACFGSVGTHPAPTPERHERATENELLLFVLLSLAFFVPSYFGILCFQGWVPSSRHFLVFIAFAGVILDCGLRLGSADSRRAGFRIAVVVLALTCLTAGPLLAGARIRATNVDLAARLINDRAKPGDLVLVAPWEVGVSFSRYCKPGVKWNTLPPLADHGAHRYDLYLKVLANKEYGAEACETLRRETIDLGDVWYVGSDLNVDGPDASGKPLISGGPFSLHAVSCLSPWFRGIECLPSLTTQPVAGYENLRVYRFHQGTGGTRPASR